MSVSPCCLKSFEWDGTPTGRTGKLAGNDTYIAGSNPDVAILYVHDLLGWTFTNCRLIADHYAREVNATVYVPDFFGGEVVPPDPILNERWDEYDIPGFVKKNTREIREPEIFECAKALRKDYKKVGAVGYCFGGWAVFRLGAKEHQPPLVDCIIAGHPTWLTKDDIDNVDVPVQLLAPEVDSVFTEELKMHLFQTMLKNKKLQFDYQHFPGVVHGCLVRGFEEVEGERQAMQRGKNAAVHWFKLFLHE